MAVYIDGLIAADSFEDASRIQGSFKELPYVHDDPGNCYVPYEDENHVWWIDIIPRGIGYGVPFDSQSDRDRFADHRSEILAKLYEHLRKCVGFKLALFGLEIGERFYDIDEDQECIVGCFRMPRDLVTAEGLVVSEGMLPLFENKDRFETFSPGYYWIPKVDLWRGFDRRKP
jgi:hypothetical protein